MSSYRNADAIQAGYVPCETNPETGGLSRTGQPFHAVAKITVGQQRGNKRHVCPDCASHYHAIQKQVSGIVWD